MMNDFQPIVGHRFKFRATPTAHWNGATDCEVLIVEPNERLWYSWNAAGDEAVDELKTIVTWTLTPIKGGTHVRMEQSGFRPEEEANYQGANYGWQRFIDALRTRGRTTGPNMKQTGRPAHRAPSRGEDCRHAPTLRATA